MNSFAGLSIPVERVLKGMHEKGTRAKDTVSPLYLFKDKT